MWSLFGSLSPSYSSSSSPTTTTRRRISMMTMVDESSSSSSTASSSALPSYCCENSSRTTKSTTNSSTIPAGTTPSRMGILAVSPSSTTTTTQPQQDRDVVGRTKDLGRESRLSFRHFAEHELRKEFKADAMKQCDLQIGAFAECIKDEGLWAPFRCRDIQNDVNECMAFYNSEERFAVYLKDHQDDLENKPFV